MNDDRQTAIRHIFSLLLIYTLVNVRKSDTRVPHVHECTTREHLIIDHVLVMFHFIVTARDNTLPISKRLSKNSFWELCRAMVQIETDIEKSVPPKLDNELKNCIRNANKTATLKMHFAKRK
jgi:hypothetical protein